MAGEGGWVETRISVLYGRPPACLEVTHLTGIDWVPTRRHSWWLPSVMGQGEQVKSRERKMEPWNTLFPLSERRAKGAERQEEVRECRDLEGKGGVNACLCALEGLVVRGLLWSPAKRWTRTGTQKRSREEHFHLSSAGAKPSSIEQWVRTRMCVGKSTSWARVVLLTGACAGRVGTPRTPSTPVGNTEWGASWAAAPLTHQMTLDQEMYLL